MTTREKVRSYLQEKFLPAGEQLPDEDGVSLSQKGVITSFGLLELVSYLEDEFQIKVDDSDLNQERFDTVSDIVSYVETHKN